MHVYNVILTYTYTYTYTCIHTNIHRHHRKRYSFKEALSFFIHGKALFILCLAGAIRNAGGYVWYTYILIHLYTHILICSYTHILMYSTCRAYNVNIFYEDYRGYSKSHIALWMSWIPLVGGSLGASFGGMYVCVCVCVCMYICIYVCMYVCMYVYVCMYQGGYQIAYLELGLRTFGFGCW